MSFGPPYIRRLLIGYLFLAAGVVGVGHVATLVIRSAAAFGVVLNHESLDDALELHRLLETRVPLLGHVDDDARREVARGEVACHQFAVDVDLLGGGSVARSHIVGLALGELSLELALGERTLHRGAEGETVGRSHDLGVETEDERDVLLQLLHHGRHVGSGDGGALCEIVAEGVVVERLLVDDTWGDNLLPDELVL